ncbi:zinc-binding alcohol dehydrogenase [Candidatus Sumerlaeota bacterium]|nr:zinc-binding alcohol dehydrogenase [Candidatus Sumerlaeota bacterium]
MKKIISDGKGGVSLADAPMPALFDESVLCRMTHSLISPGTERKGILETIGKSPEELLRTNLGYCGAGIVEESRGNEISLKKGDRAAYYGGPYVSHSEYVVVPRHLVLPVPEDVDMESAAFIGLVAISMHGFRLGRLQLGDVCAVVGAGLVGNFAARLARLAGCRIVVSDNMPERLSPLEQKDILCVSPQNLEKIVMDVSESRGADAVLLCVSAKNAEPMFQALRMIRHGGRIVILGVLDIEIPREMFFQKEAEVTISRAAGPGRYDPSYEVKGVDYPAQYARWTEGRNLRESMRLISNGSLEAKSLIAGRYPLEQIGDAYRKVLSGAPGLAHIIEWK